MAEVGLEPVGVCFEDEDGFTDAEDFDHDAVEAWVVHIVAWRSE